MLSMSFMLRVKFYLVLIHLAPHSAELNINFVLLQMYKVCERSKSFYIIVTLTFDIFYITRPVNRLGRMNQPINLVYNDIKSILRSCSGYLCDCSVEYSDDIVSYLRQSSIDKEATF